MTTSPVASRGRAHKKSSRHRELGGKSFGDVALTKGGLSFASIPRKQLERCWTCTTSTIPHNTTCWVALLTAKRWLALLCLVGVRLTWTARCLRFTAASLAERLGLPAWSASLGERIFVLQTPCQNHCVTVKKTRTISFALKFM